MAAFDYFLKIDGIPGESADAKHKDEIEVLSWSWGESQPAPGGSGTGAGSGAGVGKVAMGDLHVSANLSKASPPLLLACAAGKHFKSAVLAGRRGGGKQAEFLTFSLSDVLVSSYQTGGTTAEAPLDSISLSFSKIEIRYKQQSAKGGLGAEVRAGWDRKANKAF
jgi:type VI secretion system secreted protein Hcp